MSNSGTIHLGARQVIAAGRVIGSIPDVTLEVGEADIETLKVLDEAQAIELRKINVG
jgi:sporulation protein YlmC with PRC-barrel domain